MKMVKLIIRYLSVLYKSIQVEQKPGKKCQQGMGNTSDFPERLEVVN
jgi:hypothetical protein